MKTIETSKYFTITERFSKNCSRFRCGNEELYNKFWREQEKNMCRICQNEIGTVEYLAINYIAEIRNNINKNKSNL